MFVSSIGENVRQPHEGDEVDELRRCASQPQPAAEPVGGELEPGERVHGDGVGPGLAHVADDDAGRAWERAGGHHPLDGVAPEKSSVADEFLRRAGSNR